MYYKVVENLGGTRYSYIARFEHGDVVYRPGEWTYPNIHNSKLFIFDNEDAAIYFAKKNRMNVTTAEVWECEAESPIIAKSMCSLYDQNLVTRWWANNINSVLDIQDANGWLTMRVPAHTMYADAVKLTNLVETIRGVQ